MAGLRDYWDATKQAISDRSLKSFTETLRYADDFYPNSDDIRKWNEEKAIKAEELASPQLSPEARKRYDEQEAYAAVKAKQDQAERAYMAEVDAMRASGRLSKGDPAIDAAEARADVMGDASISGRMQFEDPAKSLEGVRQTAREAAGLPSEEQRAAASWRTDTGESYMAGLANESRAKQHREAWAVASPVTHERQQDTQANTMVLKP